MTSAEKLNEIIVSNDLEAVKRQLNKEKSFATRASEKKQLADELAKNGVSNAGICLMLGIEDVTELKKFDNWNKTVETRLEDVIAVMESDEFKTLKTDLQESVLRMKTFIDSDKKQKQKEEDEKTKINELEE